MPWEARHRGGNGFTFVYGPGDERIWTVDWTDGPEPADWDSVYTLRGLDGAVLRRFRVDGGNAEGNWLELRDTLWRGATLLATAGSHRDDGASTRHLHPDHLGTPRLITDEDGQTLAHRVFFPFGEEATAGEPALEPFRFTGHERDDLDDGGTTAELDYMHARYYSAHLGRFLPVDPVTRYDALRTPQLYNRYSYALSHSTNYVDPDGLRPLRANELLCGTCHPLCRSA